MPFRGTKEHLHTDGKWLCVWVWSSLLLLLASRRVLKCGFFWMMSAELKTKPKRISSVSRVYLLCFFCLVNEWWVWYGVSIGVCVCCVHMHAQHFMQSISRWPYGQMQECKSFDVSTRLQDLSLQCMVLGGGQRSTAEREQMSLLSLRSMPYVNWPLLPRRSFHFRKREVVRATGSALLQAKKVFSVC